MTCDICDCADHPNSVCPTCANCIGHHTISADYDEIHYESYDEHGTAHAIVYAEDDTEPVIAQDTVKPRTKPHYRYNGKTGEITLVDADDDRTTGDVEVDIIAEAFGL